MGDFVKTMKDWRRMCFARFKLRGDQACCDCRLEDFGCAIYDDEGEKDYSIVEREVSAWAAEHPEPVYPTWGEWLMEQMVIAERMRPKYDYTNGKHTDELERTGEYIAIDSEMKKQIPADIAEKLGIEPKE